ncbi:Crp/Fnr family transcriptional regulator [Gemmatimonadota bacterium]
MSTIEKTFFSGETIIKEGNTSNSFYMIRKGTVEVLKLKGNREVQLSLLGPNEFFGEMSLLDPDYSEHNATIRAVEDTTVTVMIKEEFEKYIGQLTPGMRNILRKLVTRLREADQKIVLLTENEADVS